MPSSQMLATVSVQETPLSDMVILEPRVFEDARGYFLESYNERDMAEAGIRQRFVQDNHSYSVRNVIRGLHYQIRCPQGKLVRVVEGEILDVAVDLRLSSSTFGKWHGVILVGSKQTDALGTSRVRARIPSALGRCSCPLQSDRLLSSRI